jgi:hypothetical protein
MLRTCHECCMTGDKTILNQYKNTPKKAILLFLSQRAGSLEV